MEIGYILLSTLEQTNVLELDDLNQAGCTSVYIDLHPAKRKQLRKALSSLNSGDTLVVPNFKVLGSSKLSFLQNFNLLKEKSIYLRSLKENCLLSPSSMTTKDIELIENSLPTENRLNQTTSLPISLAKKTKRKRGRPKGIPPEKLQIIDFLKTEYQGISIAKLCRLANISRQTYYNYLCK